MRNNLGQNIERELRKHGMTRRELASQLGISEAALSRYVSGKREPNIERLISISELFGVSIHDLVTSEVVETLKFQDKQ